MMVKLMTYINEDEVLICVQMDSKNILFSTPSQQELIQVYRVFPETAALDYNQRLLLYIKGNLDKEKFALAWRRVTKIFKIGCYKIRRNQYILNHHPLNLKWINNNNGNKIFNCSGFQSSAQMITDSEKINILKLDICHCFIDGHSNKLLFKSLSLAYLNLDIPFSSCSHEAFNQGLLEKEKKIFKNFEVKNFENEFKELLKNIKHLNFRTGNKPRESRREKYCFTRELFNLVEDKSQSTNNSFFTIFCAIYSKALSEFFNLDDVIFYYPFNLRSKSERNLFGYYVQVQIAFAKELKKKSLNELINYFKDFLKTNKILSVNSRNIRIPLMRLHEKGYPRFVLSFTSDGYQDLNLGSDIKIERKNIVRTQIFDSLRLYVDISNKEFIIEAWKSLLSENQIKKFWVNFLKILKGGK